MGHLVRKRGGVQGQRNVSEVLSRHDPRTISEKGLQQSQPKNSWDLLGGPLQLSLEEALDYCGSSINYLDNCNFEADTLEEPERVPKQTGTTIPSFQNSKTRHSETHLPVTSRPLIFLQKEAFLSPCNFATAHLTACILNFYLPLTSQQTLKWRTLYFATPHLGVS